MTLRYVRVFPSFDYVSPAIRPTGNLVVIGAATAGDANVPVQVSTPDEALTKFTAKNSAASALSASLATAMRQNPSATQFWGIRQDTDITKSLVAAEALNVQFVVLANTALTTDTAKTGGAIAALRDHVVTVSNRVDGKERMGVAMLTKGVAEATLVAGALADDRMVYVAHQSDDDAAAAVAGTIAGYPPYTSMVLKQVAISSAPFTAAQIDTLNGSEDESNPIPPGINGNGVVWLTSPTLIPGGGVYLGEGYTGNRAGLKFIDVQRTIDDITFRLKARMIGSIGNLRISRSGLRSLIVQMEAVLNPLVAGGVLESFKVSIPVLNLLDADPATLSPAQVQAVKDAHTSRIAQVLVSVEYAGAMHRININLKFN
ncbi:hypothetical protein [Nocardia pseudobrasiliensis]|uniref:Tail sheath protein n=1 Tax=Nocardia pseudobrasiliensis TaxID=45979 RepID=A0A370IBS4_9NOCA|nr:hypothetical protein [Nocardia pseudobrasiliensis]RDI68172.1 hypothetical protein DFR76_102573 [Nocardia pseudobrasiliensis]